MREAFAFRQAPRPVCVALTDAPKSTASAGWLRRAASERAEWQWSRSRAWGLGPRAPSLREARSTRWKRWERSESPRAEAAGAREVGVPLVREPSATIAVKGAFCLLVARPIPLGFPIRLAGAAVAPSDSSDFLGTRALGERGRGHRRRVERQAHGSILGGIAGASSWQPRPGQSAEARGPS
jgi:hypothetical protein